MQAPLHGAMCMPALVLVLRPSSMIITGRHVHGMCRAVQVKCLLVSPVWCHQVLIDLFSGSCTARTIMRVDQP